MKSIATSIYRTPLLRLDIQYCFSLLFFILIILLHSPFHHQRIHSIVPHSSPSSYSNAHYRSLLQSPLTLIHNVHRSLQRILHSDMHNALRVVPDHMAALLFHNIHRAHYREDFESRLLREHLLRTQQ
ncbi:hypothetical protein PFISCL1PPCAC_20815, partial [Pristionchus fissidentatus]